MTARVLFLPVLVWAVAGCTGSAPAAVDRSPEVAEVRAAPDRFEGAEVRWGGAVASVRNLPAETRIEVVSRVLNGSGRPVSTPRGGSRFIALVEGFLDPAIYTPGRLVTFQGVVIGSRHAQGDSVLYPVVDVRAHVLWERVPGAPSEYYDPFWYYEPYPPPP